MGKKRKPKYEDLSDKERGRLEQEGMKANSNDVSVSALDAGRSAYKEELKTRKKTNKSQKKDLKKRGETTVIQPETPREKKVKSATKQVEKMTNSPETWEGMTQDEVDAQKIRDNSTWVNTDGTITEARTTSTPGRNKDASSSAAPTYTTDPRFTTEKGKENISAQALNAIVDGNQIPQADIDAAMDEVAAVDVAVTEEQEKAQALIDAVDPNKTDGESEQDKMTTVDDLALNASDIQDQIEAGNPDAEAMMKEFQDYAKDAKMNTGEPAIEKLGLQQYYPDLGTPLQVGSYSGSRIGTVSIFGAGSNRLPMGVIDARRRALEKAANTQAKKKNEIIEMAYAKGAIPLQKRIDNKSWEIINKYSELSGNDITSLDYNTKLGRQFWKEIREHQTFAERTKMTEATVKKLTLGILDENVYVPESVQKDMRRFNEGMIKDNMDLKSIYKIEKNLRSWTEATHVLDKFNKTKLDLDKLPVNPNLDWSDPKVAKSAREAEDKIMTGNYDNIYTLTKEFLDPSRINRLIDPVIEQEGLYLGDGSKGSQDKYREEYYNYVLSLHPEKVVAQLKTVLHNSGNKAKSRGLKRDIYLKETVLDRMYDRDKNSNNLATKQDLDFEAYNYTEGGATANEVAISYTNHMGFEAVKDPNNPNLLRGIVPLTDVEKNKEIERNINSMTYRLPDGKLYTYDQVVNTAREKKDAYREKYKQDKKLKEYEISKEHGFPIEIERNLTDEELILLWEEENPKFNAFLKMDGSTTANLRIKGNTHSYAITDANGRRKELDMTNYSENEGASHNMLTRTYQGGVTVTVPRLDEKGKQAMGFIVDGYQRTREEVEDTDDLTLVPLTEVVTYETFESVDRYDIDNQIERDIANVSYTKATTQHNISVEGAGNNDDPDDAVIPSEGIRDREDGSGFTVK